MKLKIIKQNSMSDRGHNKIIPLSPYFNGSSKWEEMAGLGSDIQAPSIPCFMEVSLYNLLPLFMKPRADISLSVYDCLVVPLCLFNTEVFFFLCHVTPQ